MDRYDQLGEAITKNVKDAAEKEAVLQLLMDIRRYQAEERERAVEAAKTAKKDRKVAMICATVCVVAVLFFVGIIGIMAAGVEITRTETITQDTGTGTGNNVYQAGESAAYYQGGEELNGETSN